MVTNELKLSVLFSHRVSDGIWRYAHTANMSSFTVLLYSYQTKQMTRSLDDNTICSDLLEGIGSVALSCSRD